jgi:hypothetical protein
MTKSYKFVGGKLVERSAEEQARLQAKQAAQEPAKKKRKRTPWAQEPFVMLTLSHVEKLLRLNPACWPLFAILLFESFRARGEPFALPAVEFNVVKGLNSRTALWRALAQLEKCNLISMRRNPPRPPLITVSLVKQ